MTYSLNFTGNVPSTEDEAKILDLALGFTKELEKHGLLHAAMHGQFIGSAPALHKRNAEDKPQIFNPPH